MTPSDSAVARIILWSSLVRTFVLESVCIYYLPLW
jgi:hypothetical protein